MPRARRARDGPLRVGAERVADAGDAGDAPVDGDEDGAEALGDEGLGRSRRASAGTAAPAGLDVERGSRRARRGRRAGPEIPWPGTSTDVLDASGRRRTERPYEAPEGAGDGVRRLGLERARELERGVVALPARHRRPPLGEGAGLVEEDGVDVAEPLEGVGVLDEDPRRARPASARPTSASGTDRPSAQGQATTRRATTRSSATSGPRWSHAAPVTTARTRRAWTKRRARRSVVRRRAGLRDEGLLDDGEERADAGLVAGGVDADDEAGPEVRGAGVDGVPLPHGERRGLAGQDGVVEGRAPREDDAVHRDELAGADLDAVAGREAR